MNLVSFDIGIKNMAYCIFNVDSGCASCTAWNAMNLMPLTAAAAAAAGDRPLCSSCKRKAKYKKDALFFCEAHAKRSDKHVLPNNKEWTLPALRKKKVDELRQLVLAKTGETPLNKEACLQILQQWMTQWVLEPAVVSTLKKKSANDADLIDVGRQLCWQLDAASLPERIDMVIIENQISPLAARMRTLQGMVTQYFILRHPDAQIQYVSSSMKLKAFSTPVAAVAATAAQKYKQHKVDGVAHCAAMLRANPIVGAGRFTAETLLSHAKKDDLADCWLQALWFLKHVGKIDWSAEDLKIKCVDG